MNKMKICLIIPPSPFLLDERVFVQLGILKIAAILEQKNYSVDLVDLSGVDNYIDVLNDYINVPGRSDIFGITATTPQIPYAVKVGQFLKSKLPGNMSKTILGGPHVTLMHTAAKREKNKNFAGSDRAHKDVECLKEYFDFLVCGDGELAIIDAITTNEKVIDADMRSSNSDTLEPHEDIIFKERIEYLLNKKLSVNPVAQKLLAY